MLQPQEKWIWYVDVFCQCNNWLIRPQIGSFRYAGTWAEAVDLLAASASGEQGKGLGPIAKVLTHRFTSLADASKAFELLIKGKDEEGRPVLKVLVGEGSL